MSSLLRERMVEDMILAGLAESTKKSYLRQVEGLARFYTTAPDELSERQVRDYFLYLREEKQVSRGAFQQAIGGLRFLYYVTLENDWTLFSKKRSPCHFKNVCRTRGRTRKFERCSRRFGIRFIVHACARCTHVDYASVKRRGFRFRQSTLDRCCLRSPANATSNALSP
jgi:hypothetical protein